MKTPEDIIKALEICANRQKVINAAETAAIAVNACASCPYGEFVDCQSMMKTDAACYIKAQISLIERLSEKDKSTLTAIERIEAATIDLLKSVESIKQIANDGMTANDYQRAAMRTAWTKTKEDLPPKVLAMLESGAFNKNELLLLNGVLGLGGESGEAEDLVKKWIFQGHDLAVKEVAEELCDVAWYLAVSSYALGFDLGEIFQMNVDKLMKRYPDGFDKNRSINREEGGSNA